MELKSILNSEIQSSTTTLESSKCNASYHSRKRNKTKTERKSLAFMLAFASIMASNFISIMDTVIVATALQLLLTG